MYKLPLPLHQMEPNRFQTGSWNNGQRFPRNFVQTFTATIRHRGARARWWISEWRNRNWSHYVPKIRPLVEPGPPCHSWRFSILIKWHSVRFVSSHAHVPSINYPRSSAKINVISHHSRPSQSHGPRRAWETAAAKHQCSGRRCAKFLSWKLHVSYLSRLTSWYVTFPLQKMEVDHPNVSLGDQIICEVSHHIFFTICYVRWGYHSLAFIRVPRIYCRCNLHCKAKPPNQQSLSPWSTTKICGAFSTFLFIFCINSSKSIVHTVPIQQLNVAYTLSTVQVAEGDPKAMEIALKRRSRTIVCPNVYDFDFHLISQS